MLFAWPRTWPKQLFKFYFTNVHYSSRHLKLSCADRTYEFRSFRCSAQVDSCCWYNSIKVKTLKRYRRLPNSNVVIEKPLGVAAHSLCWQENACISQILCIRCAVFGCNASPAWSPSPWRFAPGSTSTSHLTSLESSHRYRPGPCASLGKELR